MFIVYCKEDFSIENANNLILDIENTKYTPVWDKRIEKTKSNVVS